MPSIVINHSSFTPNFSAACHSPPSAMRMANPCLRQRAEQGLTQNSLVAASRNAKAVEFRTSAMGNVKP